jgi:hypothetical protein
MTITKDDIEQRAREIYAAQPLESHLRRIPFNLFLDQDRFRRLAEEELRAEREAG